MQSNLVKETEAEISPFYHDEHVSTKNNSEEATTEHKSKTGMIETTYSATDKSSSRFHPNEYSSQAKCEKNSGGNKVLAPPTSRFIASGSIIRHINEERSERENDQYMENAELHETSIPATELPIKEVQTAKGDLTCDRDCDIVEVSEHNSSRPDASATKGDENRQSGRCDVADSANCDFVEHGGRFSVPPPTYSNLYSVSLDHEGVPLSSLFFEEQNQEHKSPRPSLNPQKISERENVTTPSSIQQGEEDTNIPNRNMAGAVTGDDEQSDIILHDIGTQDDDSNFGIPEKEKPTETIEQHHNEKCEDGEIIHSNKKIKNRRRSRQRRKQQILESLGTDDETSIENYGTTSASQLTGLQERTYQAWKSRQKKNTTTRLRNDSKSQSNKMSNVSFGASDTIHHFDPGVPDRYKCDKEEEEDMSLDRSLNSEYTKTLESEVEDMIKDILFIGNPQKSKPGRRKYRYKADPERKSGNNQRPKTKMDYRRKTVSENGTNSGKIEDETSLTSEFDEKYKAVNDSRLSIAEKRKLSRSKYLSSTYGDDTCSAGSTVSRGSSIDSNTVETFQSGKDAIEDPLNAMIGLVEGGLSVMTSAIGYALGDQIDNKTQEDTINNGQKPNSDFDIFESCGIHVPDERVKTASNNQIFARTTNTLSKSALIDHTSGVVPFNPKSSSPSPKRSKKIPELRIERDIGNAVMKGNRKKSDRENTDSRNGAELIELAMYAARSAHKLQGVNYDESVVIDTYKEVKKCHVTLELPLGSKYLHTIRLPLNDVAKRLLIFITFSRQFMLHIQLFSLRMMVRQSCELF